MSVACQYSKSSCIIALDNKSTYSAVKEGNVLFSTISKPGKFGLGMALMENFPIYSTQFIFTNMVTIDMCGKSPITGEWIHGIM